MARKPELIIVDTNLWISFLIKRSYSKLDKVLVSGHAKLAFSDELLAEFIEVTARRKFKPYISLKDVAELLESINAYATFFEVKSIDAICRDPKDDFLLALAKVSNADYLLTGDQDLLVLKKVGRTRIIPISEYLSKF